jgi:hypothetical protein
MKLVRFACAAVWALVWGCGGSGGNDPGQNQSQETASTTKYYLGNCELSREGKATKGYLTGTFGVKDGIKDGAEIEKDTVAYISEGFPGQKQHTMVVRGGTVIDAEKQIFEVKGRHSGKFLDLFRWTGLFNNTIHYDGTTHTATFDSPASPQETVTAYCTFTEVPTAGDRMSSDGPQGSPAP